MFSDFCFVCCVPVRVVVVQLHLTLFGCDGRIQLRVCFVFFSGVSLCEDREEDLDLTHERCCVSFLVRLNYVFCGTATAQASKSRRPARVRVRVRGSCSGSGSQRGKVVVGRGVVSFLWLSLSVSVLLVVSR